MRPILAVVLGAIVAALLAWLATVVIANTSLPSWLDIVAWVVALVAWLFWSFPRYFNSLT
jgi:hypothetical protein